MSKKEHPHGIKSEKPILNETNLNTLKKEKKPDSLSIKKSKHKHDYVEFIEVNNSIGNHQFKKPHCERSTYCKICGKIKGLDYNELKKDYVQDSTLKFNACRLLTLEELQNKHPNLEVINCGDMLSDYLPENYIEKFCSGNLKTKIVEE